MKMKEKAILLALVQVQVIVESARAGTVTGVCLCYP